MTDEMRFAVLSGCPILRIKLSRERQLAENLTGNS